MDVPTSPITGTPSFPFATYLSAIDSREFLSVILAIVFFFWLVYTLIAAYHWVRYGHRSLLALPVLAIHVAVSGWFALIAVSGFY
jgi:hypothetical protein